MKHVAPDHPDDARERVEGWSPCPSCRARTMNGRHVAIEPFDAMHAAGLWEAFGGEAMNERIRWFGWPQMEDAGHLATLLEGFAARDGWSTAVFIVGGAPAGMASYMREDAANGVVETGAIALSARMERSAAATEGHWLMMRHAFGLGYRRYEWKCDDANEASKAAAKRLGFTYEGTFRQHQVKHGRNRNTAWFSMLDHEWPLVDAAIRAWLDPSNMDAQGRQRRKLGAIREEMDR